jgi:glycosyltransferase involved in cell wall biosynthesis
MRILVYALHVTTLYTKGYIGGAWIRFIELQKRAEKFDIKYVLVEPPPKFGNNYESILVNSNGYKKIGDIASTIFEATIKGIRRVLKGDIDLILSPIESPHCVLPAFVTSMLTRTPFTVIIHNTPVFHALIEKYPNKKFTPSLRHFYNAIKHHKHRGKSISFVILSTLFNYFILKILRTTTIIGVGSGATYLQSLDKNLHVKEVFPANSLPSSAIVEGKKPFERKTYDAIYVGSLTKEKGVLDALYAWRLVTIKNPSLKLHLIGRVNNKKMLQQLNHLINKLDLGNNVYLCDNPFVGTSTEILLKSMKKSKIMLFPSTFEAWSFTVGEALSLGLPVIGYDIQAYKRAYPKCKALIKVPIGNLHKLAVEATKLFENPNNLLLLSKEAVQYMKNYYTWEQVISAEKKLYEEVIFSSSHTRWFIPEFVWRTSLKS